MLDFIGFISDNANLSAGKKVALLKDFCTQYNYQLTIWSVDEGGDPIQIPNPESRREFANRHITRFIRESVNAVRRQVAVETLTYEELELEQI